MILNSIKTKPRLGERILIFSPNYSKDNDIRWRIIDSQFLKICKDATHWAYLEDDIILL